MTKIENLLVSRGFDLEQLIDDKTEYKTTNIDAAAESIKRAVEKKRPIRVVADYDCDGIMSGWSMFEILHALGANFEIRFPRRMSEGYGLSLKIIDELPANCLLITIDNGIACVEAIDAAKDRGMEVVILDHHLKRDDGLIPDADIIVDPHVFKEEGEFEDYCGAGLAYILSKQEVLGLPNDVIQKCCVLASIATIQDIVPLTGDNRNIIKEGLLKCVNYQKVNMPGLYALIGALRLEPSVDVRKGVQEESVSFQIGPCINAMGRLHDDGAQQIFENLVHYDIHGMDGIDLIISNNDERKKITAAQDIVLEIEAQKQLGPRPSVSKATCLVLYAEDLLEGIMGINATHILNKYNMPCIAFTDSEEEGFIKGSARSTEDIHMKDSLDQVSDLIAKYGGHAGAAGITIEKKKLDAFTKAINKVIPKTTVCGNSWQYDFEVDEADLPVLYDEIRKYAPWGSGNPAPVIRINNFKLEKSYGKYYRLLGEKGISFNGKNYEAVSFDREVKEKYLKLGEPLEMNIVGTLSWSNYNNKVQIMLTDFQPIISKTVTGPLI